MWDEEQKRGEEEWQKWIHFPSEHEERVDGKLRGKWYELTDEMNGYLCTHKSCQYINLFYVVWIKLVPETAQILILKDWDHVG